ncbi:MAG: cell surface protein [Myxococcota bacterium]
MDAPLALSILGLGALIGCGGAGPGAGGAGLGSEASIYATRLIDYDPGEGGGFGADRLPGVVLGAPVGRGTNSGSTDVVSLGAGGAIVVGFDAELVDGPGLDFVVFENAFWASGDPSAPFTDLGAVALSTDAQSWHELACDLQGDGHGHYPGCAGWNPVHIYDAARVVPLDPELSGGDAFDLADFGLSRARFVRVRDLEGKGEAPIRGFDLDAVGLIHAAEIVR